MSRLALCLLGPPRVELGNEALHIPRRKAVALLAYLAVTGRAHQRDALATLLWPEHDQSSARAELRRTLSLLNRTLGAGWIAADREIAGLSGGGSRTAPTTDSLAHSPDRVVWLDVTAFQERLDACAAHDHPHDQPCPDCLSLLEEAAALYRDDFLAGFTLRDSAQFDEWQFFQTQSLKDGLAGALEQLAASCGERGEHARAISHARRWLSLDPLHEPAHRALMCLYAQDGQRAAALRQYRQCVRVLEEELDAAPEAETTALYRQIRAERPQPTEEAVAQAPAPPAPVLPAFLREDKEVEPERPPFVGREVALARLDGYLNAALEGEGGVAFVTGGAGRGKTALLAEFARRAAEAHPDLLVAWGTCNAYAGLGDAYLPFREVLAMLTGDVEGRWRAGTVTREHAGRLWEALPLAVAAVLDHGGALVDTLLPGAALLARAEAAAGEGSFGDSEQVLHRLRERVAAGGPEPGEGAQEQLLGQATDVLRALAERQPLLLLLDDLQWADGASVSLLFHLGRRLGGSRVLVVGAYRPDEVALGRDGERHPLEKALSEFRRSYGDMWVDLREADEAEGRGFVDALLDSEPNRLGEGFRAALYAHTGGHALFTVELLRAMQGQGDLIRDKGGRWTEGASLDWVALPARVEAVIAERVGRLGEELREVLAVASVEGETFTAQVVAQVQGLGERETLRLLSRELEGRHQLVQEEGTVAIDGTRLTRYRFAHALYQQYVHDGLGAGERALLHGEVGEALERLHAGRTDEVAAQLAHLYTEAGDADKAVVYLDRAGDRARLAYAHQEAEAHYRRALATLVEQGHYGRAARTLMKLGLTYHSAFRFPEARQAYDEGFALWQRAGKEAHADLSPAPHALRLPWTSPENLDPALAIDRNSINTRRILFSGLLEETPDMNVVPGVAKRWEIRADGCEYIFYLRDDVRWSDGVPVTAADFCYGWRRILDPATGSPRAEELYRIEGARAFHEGKAVWEQVGVRALDAITLTVRLEAPDSRFLEQIGTSTYAFPVPRHVVEAYGPRWTEVEHLVTNGPFRLERWERGERILLTRNQAYHGQSTGNVERIELYLIPGDEWDTLGLALYEADALDTMHVMSQTLERIRHRHAGEHISQPEASSSFVGFNLHMPPFDDPRVRQALALAVDCESLADVVLGGTVSPATGGFVPLGVPGHSPGIGLPYDPPRARRLLAQAGYPDGRGFPVVEALTVPRFPILSPHLQEQWRKNLGIEVPWVIPEDLRELSIRLTGAGDPPQMFLLAIFGDLDPASFVESLEHWLRWQDETYTELVAQARRAGDPNERLGLYAQADKVLTEAAALVPLTYERRHRLFKPWIARWPSNPVRECFLGDVVIEPH